VAGKELEADDPMEFVAMRFPVPQGMDADAEMARCLVEDYALMGMPPEKVLHLFKSRFFAGAHAVLESRGEPFVQAIIDNVFGLAGREEVPDAEGI
jgi:hypothetical protein